MKRKRSLFPALDRISEPGSTATTALGVFLAYISPVVFALGVVPSIAGQYVTGSLLLGAGVASWAAGHHLAGR